MDKKYIFSSLFLSIIIFIIYKYKYSDSNKITKNHSNVNSTDLKPILKDLNKLLKYEIKNKKIITKQLKEISNLNKLQLKYIKNTNKNIFNKNIEKHRLFIDTHNIFGDFDKSNYTYYLSGSSEHGITNETGGYSEFKNVIGFRLIKAIIPNTEQIITDSRNIIIVQIGNNSYSSDDNKLIKIVLPSGFYDVSSINTAFSQASYTWYDLNGSLTENQAEYYVISTEFDMIDKHFKFSMKGPSATGNNQGDSNLLFKFLWTNIGLNSARKILGFNNIDTSEFSDNIESDIVPDMSHNYIDLIIDEIPSIACKYNAKGHKLIDRIGITSEPGELFEYISCWENKDENYFYPIKLNKLSIKLLESNQNHYYKSDRDHTFEFEITIIKNIKEFNLN